MFWGIVGIIVFFIGFVIMITSMEFIEAIGGILLIMVGLIIIYANIEQGNSEIRENEAQYTQEREILVIEKIQEVTGEESVGVISNKDNKDFLIEAGDKIYEVKIEKDLILYEIKDNVIKIE